MVKLHYKNLLTLGLIPAELEHLKQGQPIQIRLDDLGLTGQVIVIIAGESNEKLEEAAKAAADRLEKMSSKRIIDVTGKVIQ